MVRKVQKRYSTLLWVSGLLLFTFLSLLLFMRQAANKFKPIARTQLRELVQEATDSLYHISFSDISINLLTGRATLNDVKITPDTSMYRKLIARKKAPNNIYHITLKKLVIRSFHPLRYLKQKKLNIDLLLFEKPDVVMQNTPFDFNETRKQDPGPYHYLSKYLKELWVKRIDLKNISFKYIRNNSPVPETDSVSNLNITLKDWRIDSLSATDPGRIYYLKDATVNLSNYTYATPDSMYHIKLEQLDFKAATGQLNIKNFGLIPRYSEMQFGQRAGFAKDRFNVQVSDISMEGIDLPLYIRRQELYAKEMTAANGQVEVFNNNMLERNTAVRTGRYPQQLLQKIKSRLTVKQLNLSDIDFSYAEYDKKSRQKGIITFEKTSGILTNITNAESIKAQNPYLFASLRTYMMGQGQLDVNFRFDLQAADGAFTYSGMLGPMDGRVLNRITKPLGMVEVKHGNVKKMEFELQANDRIAQGKMMFAYDELSVALLKREEGKERLVKQGLMSILANAMVINPENPNTEGILVTAPIRYERVRTASFFNFVWRTLFQGIKYSVGVTPAKEKEIKAKIASFEKIKTDRDKRRAERQKRRARQGK